MSHFPSRFRNTMVKRAGRHQQQPDQNAHDYPPTSQLTGPGGGAERPPGGIRLERTRRAMPIETNHATPSQTAVVKIMPSAVGLHHIQSQLLRSVSQGIPKCSKT